MIVQPDFLDHWKTQMLCDILQDPCAPLYVIRLWAHCQNRKTHRLPTANPAATKAICRAPQEAEMFHSAMLNAGFIRQDDEGIYAHEWDDVNQYLINSWENGKKGGRPKKITQTKPTGNPRQTQSEPIREEKRRVEEEKARNRIEYSPDFEAFWKLYGVGGKKPAFEAWLKQNPSTSEQSEILRAVPIYKTYCSENERSLKDGQGWISQRYWETDWNRQPKTKRPERFGPSLEGAI